MGFISHAEANDWLPYDTPEASTERERASWDEPDRYADWAAWRNRWEARGEADFYDPDYPTRSEIVHA